MTAILDHVRHAAAHVQNNLLDLCQFKWSILPYSVFEVLWCKLHREYREFIMLLRSVYFHKIIMLDLLTQANFFSDVSSIARIVSEILESEPYETTPCQMGFII